MKEATRSQAQTMDAELDSAFGEQVKVAVRGAHGRRAVVLDQASLEQVRGGVLLIGHTEGFVQR